MADLLLEEVGGYEAGPRPVMESFNTSEVMRGERCHYDDEGGGDGEGGEGGQGDMAHAGHRRLRGAALLRRVSPVNYLLRFLFGIFCS